MTGVAVAIADCDVQGEVRGKAVLPNPRHERGRDKGRQPRLLFSLSWSGRTAAADRVAAERMCMSFAFSPRIPVREAARRCAMDQVLSPGAPAEGRSRCFDGEETWEPRIADSRRWIPQSNARLPAKAERLRIRREPPTSGRERKLARLAGKADAWPIDVRNVRPRTEEEDHHETRTITHRDGSRGTNAHDGYGRSGWPDERSGR
jgi:hypothetical protein